MIETFTHAPGANLDYGFDWKSNGWLAEGETIETSTWSAPGLTVTRQLHANGITAAFIAGGKKGNTYKVTNTITTSEGRTDSRTITLAVEDR